MEIPFYNLKPIHSRIEHEILSSFKEVFDGNHFILGPKLKLFEKQFADFLRVNHCIGISNGLDALTISLQALEIGPGDEIIVPIHTFAATILSVLEVGATPVFVEPEIDTYNIDSSKIEASITDRTKAILPVHLYGQPCNMTNVMSIAQRHKVFVVEDNAQSHGAHWSSQYSGSFGDLAAVSFYPAKNLGALGDGGAILTNNDVLFNKSRLLRNYGSDKKYHHKILGKNNRLDECQAAFLSVKLQYLDEWNKERNRIAQIYSTELSAIEQVSTPKILPEAYSVYHQYVIRCDKRDSLQGYLKEKGISTLIHYPIPIHFQECFKLLGYKKGDFPIAEKLSGQILSLPIYPGLENREMDYIINCIKSFWEKY